MRSKAAVVGRLSNRNSPFPRKHDIEQKVACMNFEEALGADGGALHVRLVKGTPAE
jgi:hypothetical protein